MLQYRVPRAPRPYLQTFRLLINGPRRRSVTCQGPLQDTMAILNHSASAKKSDDSVVSRHTLTRQSPRVAAHVAGQITSKLDVLAAVVLISVVVGCALAPRPMPLFHDASLQVDYSYMTDMAYKSEQHIWLGRDTAFTYGPLYQLLWGLSSRIHGFSLGSFFRFGHLLPFCYSTVLILGFALLLLSGCPSWKRALYVTALMCSWTYFDVRHATVLFCFALCLVQTDQIARRNKGLALRASIIALSLLLAFCISSDTGMYSVVAAGLVALAYLVCFRKSVNITARISKFVLLQGASFLIQAFALCAVFGARFWIDRLAIISSYRWSMAIPIHVESWTRLAVAIALFCLAFAAGWKWRDSESPTIVRRPVFLVSAPLLSVCYLQSALVRSDWPHLVFGLFPAVALACAVFISLSRRWFTVIFSIIVLALVACYNTPYPVFLRGIVSGAVYAHYAPSLTACQADTVEIDGVCFDPPSAKRLTDVSSYIDAHTSSSDPIFVFPWENAYGVVARRRVAGGVLQNYAAAGDVLVHRQLEALEKDRPPLVIYFADEISWGVDGVTSFTRSPETWLYLQSHYSTVAEIEPSLFILHRDPTRFQHWSTSMKSLPLNPAARYVKVKGPTQFDVSKHLVPGADVDLLRLQLIVHYPLSWHFRKPWRLAVLVYLANGTRTWTYAVLPPNRVAEVWVSPWQPNLGSYFSPNDRDWNARIRPPISRIRLVISPMDWISLKPSSISVRSLDAVKLSLNESSRALAQDPAEFLPRYDVK